MRELIARIRRTGLRAVPILLGMSVLISGCTQATPHGVTLRNGTVVALYKPCVPSAVAELELYDVTDLSRPPAWSARLIDFPKESLNFRSCRKSRATQLPIDWGAR